MVQCRRGIAVDHGAPGTVGAVKQGTGFGVGRGPKSNAWKLVGVVLFGVVCLFLCLFGLVCWGDVLLFCLVCNFC